MKKLVYPAKPLRSGTVVLVFVLCCLFTVSPAFAITAPNPQPCSYIDAKNTDNLSHNVITAGGAEAPIIIADNDFKVSGKDGETKELPSRTFQFEVDFSKLQALFASSASDYLGGIQDQAHGQTNILNLDSGTLNSYFGASQKLTPKIITDKLKENYINYVYNNPHLLESTNKYTDINGQGGDKTIYDLVNQFGGLPKVPQSDEQNSSWENTWGKYWAKIPIAYNETYKGAVGFKSTLGETEFQAFKNGERCPVPLNQINFVMPEFFRAAQVSDSLNQMLVPHELQADPKHTILNLNGENSSTKGPAQYILSACKQLLENAAFGLQNGLKNIIKVSFNFLNPIKPVFAAQAPCIKPLEGDKNGQASYCPLPQEEIDRLSSENTGVKVVSCGNKQDNLNLDKSGKNVICTFNITWPNPAPRATFIISKDDSDCQQDLDSNGKSKENLYTCRPKLRIWPDFMIPWSARFSKNTTLSTTDTSNTGKVGFFGIFTPKAIIGTDSLKQLDEAGKTQQSLTEKDIKLDFVKGIDCSKQFARDSALKPKALQEDLGLDNNCK